MKAEEMSKAQLVNKIIAHHLYQPQQKGIYSKHYKHYNPNVEFKLMMKKRKNELIETYNAGYNYDGRELSAHEIYC